jgi:hypothetical protein
MRYLGDGPSAEVEAVQLAEGGDLVICGMTKMELQANRPKKTINHGHVAVLVGGWGKTGWPLAYWGSYGDDGVPGRNESLSISFRATDRKTIHYFAFSVPKQ